ncbi:hypothetical protein [Humibacter ginsenosidimutans]|uniref:hypothetical protein n=1 Tax=Humibacter ginsenosidimutans TaxID=2599293 RepID=UPI00143CC1DD|nr:hypothetical protein [Humibacter ginsenosidimutans]
MPDGWFEVPRTEEGLAAIGAELDALVDTSEARALLGRAARVASEETAADPHPNRRTWAGVGDREAGRVDAYLTLETLTVRGLDQDWFLNAWSTFEPGGGNDMWLRDYEKKTLSGRRAVSGRDFMQAPADDSGNRQLTETYRAVLFTPVLSTVLLMSIITKDLGVFEDIVGYGDTIADTFTFSNVRSAA